MECGYELDDTFQNKRAPYSTGARDHSNIDFKLDSKLRRSERIVKRSKSQLKKKTPSLWLGITILLLGIFILGVAYKVSWVSLSAEGQGADYGIDMEKKDGAEGAPQSLPDYWADVSSLSIIGALLTIILGAAITIISSLKYVYEEKRELYCILNLVCGVIVIPFNLLIIYVGGWFNGLSISDLSSGGTVGSYTTPVPLALLFIGAGLLSVSLMLVHFESKHIFKRSKSRKLEQKLSRYLKITGREF